MPYKGKKSKLKTAVILSGGGARGAFEIGALKVLLDKIIPDIIIGTSVGAINGSFVALGAPIETIEQNWYSINKSTIFPLNKKILYKFHLVKSIYRNKQFKTWLSSKIGSKQFKDCKIPLYINATRLHDGKGVFFHQGNLLEAIMASTAIIPFFPSYTVNGTQYIDGGFSNYIGTEEALALKCRQIIVINLGYNGKREFYERGLFHLTNHIIELLSYQSFQKEIELCQHDNVVVIAPQKGYKVHLTDFSQTRSLIREGEKQAKIALRRIIM